MRRFDDYLEAARAGKSDAIFAGGEPGVGQSTLLAYVQDRAEGMLVLSTRGIESDSVPACGRSSTRCSTGSIACRDCRRPP